MLPALAPAFPLGRCTWRRPWRPGRGIGGLAVVQHIGGVLAVHGNRGGDHPADGVQILTVGGDVHIQLDRCLVQEHRQLGRVGARLDRLVVRSVRRVWALWKRKTRGLSPLDRSSTATTAPGNNDGFRGQDQQVPDPVATVGEIEQKGGLEQHADGGNKHQHHQRGWIAGAAAPSLDSRESGSGANGIRSSGSFRTRDMVVHSPKGRGLGRLASVRPKGAGIGMIAGEMGFSARVVIRRSSSNGSWCTCGPGGSGRTVNACRFSVAPSLLHRSR